MRSSRFGVGSTDELTDVGSREMVGSTPSWWQRDDATEYIVQVEGKAIRADALPLRQAFDQSKEFREVMLRFPQAMLAYVSQNAACNRFHNVEQRLARSLLECSDRLNSDELGLTHECVAEMLGVRRAGVSLSTSKLQDNGIIAKGGGVIKIIDWKRLEAVSCECYAVLSEEYDWLLGRPVY